MSTDTVVIYSLLQRRKLSQEGYMIGEIRISISQVSGLPTALSWPPCCSQFSLGSVNSLVLTLPLHSGQQLTKCFLHLLFMTTLGSGYYGYPHLTDEETELPQLPEWWNQHSPRLCLHSRIRIRCPILKRKGIEGVIPIAVFTWKLNSWWMTVGSFSSRSITTMYLLCPKV